MLRTRPSTDRSAADESARSPRPFVRHGRQKRHSLPRTLVKAAAAVSGVGIAASVSIVAIAATLLVQSAQPSVDLHPVAALTQDGMSTYMSRGKETTVALVWSAETCRSMFTSFRTLVSWSGSP